MRILRRATTGEAGWGWGDGFPDFGKNGPDCVHLETFLFKT